jgi:hypothetical protein
VLFSEEVDDQQALALRDKLRILPNIPLNPFGDHYVKGEGGYQMIEVASSPIVVDAAVAQDRRLGVGLLVKVRPRRVDDWLFDIKPKARAGRRRKLRPRQQGTRLAAPLTLLGSRPCSFARTARALPSVCWWR